MSSEIHQELFTFYRIADAIMIDTAYHDHMRRV